MSGYEIVSASANVGPTTAVPVFCSAGKHVLGGGADVSPELAGDALARSEPSGNNAWIASYTSGNGQAHVVSVWVICAFTT